MSKPICDLFSVSIKALAFFKDFIDLFKVLFNKVLKLLDKVGLNFQQKKYKLSINFYNIV